MIPPQPKQDEATELLEATVREIMLQAPIPERLYEIAVKIETYLKDRG